MAGSIKKRPFYGKQTQEISAYEAPHREIARKAAAEGIVLLKNENNLLPVAPGIKKILVVGENAIKMMTVGGGSSSLPNRNRPHHLLC